jgi:hypothetical protein
VTSFWALIYLTHSNRSPEFKGFEALARRILTTPKADLMKGAPPAKVKPPKQASKRKQK